MQAWMYQLNPERGFVRGLEDELVPASSENLFRRMLLSGEEVMGPWYVSQFFRDAEVGDPLLIRVGGKEQAGIVACGHIAWIDNWEGEWELGFRPDVTASLALRDNPIPSEWIREVVPKSQRNLVRLEPFWDEIAAELHKRSAFPQHVELRGAPGDEFDEEGERSYGIHAVIERSKANRDLVLSAAERPYRCQGCGFSFGQYGEEYGHCIEVHHLHPVSLGLRRPKAEDFALLCSNCHTIVHWKRGSQPLSIEELRQLVGKERPTFVHGSSPIPHSAVAARPEAVVVDDSTEGQGAIFIFDTEDSFKIATEAVKSVASALASLASEDCSSRILVWSGDVVPTPTLSHLLLEDFFRPERFAVVVEGPLELLGRLLGVWAATAPPSAVAGGTIVTGGEELGLVLRAVISPEGGCVIAHSDPGQGLDTIIPAAGIPLTRVSDLALQAVADGELTIAQAAQI